MALIQLRVRIAFGCVISALALACGEPESTPQTSSGPPTGTVIVDGSSTLLPLSRALGEDVQRANPGVTIKVSESGTGGGFEKLCTGAADLIGASRAINAAEARQCQQHGVAFVELPMAFDSLSVVVHPSNDFAACLTVAELKRIWEPAAEKKVTRWNQVRSSFPAQPITLAGPGKASGTFDYFTLAIVGVQGQSRSDYLQSEDDEVLVKTVASDRNAISYFGFDYYVEHRDALKLVAVDNGGGCVTPSAATVADGTYEPLSRPLFAYASATALKRPAVLAVARAYVNPGNADVVRKIGFLPLPIASLLIMGHRLETGETGSRFGGRGSVVGLTVDEFGDEERIKNALVR